MRHGRFQVGISRCHVERVVIVGEVEQLADEVRHLGIYTVVDSPLFFSVVPYPPEREGRIDEDVFDARVPVVGVSPVVDILDVDVQR